jgi:hypothetical protein
MCLVTTLWQQSYLLTTNWIELVISASEEIEYYGIYDPNIINVTIGFLCFQLIEYWGEIFLKSAFLKLRNKI